MIMTCGSHMSATEKWEEVDEEVKEGAQVSFLVSYPH